MKRLMRMGRITIALALCIYVMVVVIVFVVTILPIRQAEAEPLDTYHSSWHLVRETADEDGATFAAVYDLTTAGNFANKDSSTVANGGPFNIRSVNVNTGAHEGYSAGGAWMFAICGKNYNNTDDTFSFNIIGWSKLNGMLQTVAEGNGTLGTQAVIVYPDGGTALGELVDMTAVTYDHSGGAEETYFSKTDVGLNVVAGMLAYVTGTNITSGYYQVTIVTDDDNIKIAVTASDDNTDSTVQINPAFWADTIALDETTKWPAVSLHNSGDNEVAFIVVDTTGLEWVQFVIYDADAATGEEAGDLTVYGRRY